jgi:flagellum-specific peptidoglycan hydrolase FlgJ
MKKQIIISYVRDYVSRHWFKLSLLLLIIIACFRKDLSLSVRFNSEKENKKVELKKDTKITAAATNEKVSSTPLSIIEGFLSKNGKNEEFPEIDDDTKISFLKRFAQVAVAEQKKYGIPASIVLANALQQSFAGKRELTLKSNNHFALPCTFDWTGGNEQMGSECYRKYENAWLSFRDHSIFITSGKFSELRNSKDYKAWAKGLQSLGYPSGSDNLAEDLIKIIEKYGLNNLDKL